MEFEEVKKVGTLLAPLVSPFTSAQYQRHTAEYSWDGLASPPVGSRHSPRYFLPWKNS